MNLIDMYLISNLNISLLGRGNLVPPAADKCSLIHVHLTCVLVPVLYAMINTFVIFCTLPVLSDTGENAPVNTKE